MEYNCNIFFELFRTICLSFPCSGDGVADVVNVANCAARSLCHGKLVFVFYIFPLYASTRKTEFSLSLEQGSASMSIAPQVMLTL